MNVPVTGRHALLSLDVFVPLLYTVYVLFMIMLFGVYIGLKESVIKGVMKGYIILCTIHYLLLIMATFYQATLGLSCLCYEAKKKKKEEEVSLCLCHSGHGYV